MTVGAFIILAGALVTLYNWIQGLVVGESVSARSAFRADVFLLLHAMFHGYVSACRKISLAPRSASSVLSISSISIRLSLHPQDIIRRRRSGAARRMFACVMPEKISRSVDAHQLHEAVGLISIKAVTGPRADTARGSMRSSGLCSCQFNNRRECIPCTCHQYVDRNPVPADHCFHPWDRRFYIFLRASPDEVAGALPDAFVRPVHRLSPTVQLSFGSASVNPGRIDASRSLQETGRPVNIGRREKKA